jgi:hypothetical protein
LSEEGKKVRQEVQRFSNEIISKLAGANVAPSEIERIKNQLGTGLLKGDQDLRNALQSAVNTLYGAVVGIESGIESDTLAEYSQKKGAIHSGLDLFKNFNGGNSDGSLITDELLDNEIKRRKTGATASW